MNLGALKALESWINDRLQAYSAYHMNVSKARSLFESFENMQGTLRMAFDSMYLFTEQVSLRLAITVTVVVVEVLVRQ